MNKKQNINIRMSSYYILMSIFNFQIMWVDISYSGVVQSECPDFTLIIIDLPQRFSLSLSTSATLWQNWFRIKIQTYTHMNDLLLSHNRYDCQTKMSENWLNFVLYLLSTTLHWLICNFISICFGKFVNFYIDWIWYLLPPP